MAKRIRNNRPVPPGSTRMALADVIARLNAAAVTHPDTPESRQARADARFRELAARSSSHAPAPVTPAAPADPEPSLPATVDARPPVLPIGLPPRTPSPTDPQIEHAETVCRALHADWVWEDDEQFQSHALREFFAEEQRIATPGVRVARVLGEWGEFQGVLSLAHACAACDTPMTYDITVEAVRGACPAGCAPAAIGSALRCRVEETERHERATAQDEAVATIAAEVSILNLLNVPPQQWVIPGFVAQDGLTLLVGDAGDGKTFAAMHAGMAVALGEPWFATATVQQRALLMLLDGANADNGRRLSLLAAGFDTDLDSLAGLLDVYPLGRGFQSDDPASMQRLIDTIIACGHRFVVIDNLTNARSPGDENSTANLTAALLPLTALAHEREIGILLIHHANRKGTVRGSSAIPQHPDAIFELERKNKENASPVIMTRSKDRYGASLSRLRWRFIDRLDADGNTVAILPTLISDARPEDVDAAAPGAPKKAPPVPKGPDDDIPETPHFAELLGILPIHSEAIYRHFKGRLGRAHVLVIRNQLERHGRITLNGKDWHRV